MFFINILNLKIHYNHPHDLIPLIETCVLDIYRLDLLNKGDTVLDLGAGIGEFTLLASKKVGPNGRIIAIEPSPDDYETLLRNIKENKCDNVSPINIAVADFNEEREFEFKGKTFSAVCKPLRDILNEEKVGKVNFCKMDIEGGEREVIPPNASIFSDIHYLSMEIHNGYQYELVPFMERLGFSFERIKRRNYIRNALKFTLRHPIKAYQLLHLLKQAGEYPGFGKIMRGIKIASSNNLVVGTFVNSGMPP
ncbi:MAG: FkbM family methyltransferase [Thermoplasmatales archaeon]